MLIHGWFWESFLRACMRGGTYAVALEGNPHDKTPEPVDPISHGSKASAESHGRIEPGRLPIPFTAYRLLTFLAGDQANQLILTSFLNSAFTATATSFPRTHGGSIICS